MLTSQSRETKATGILVAFRILEHVPARRAKANLHALQTLFLAFNTSLAECDMIVTVSAGAFAISVMRSIDGEASAPPRPGFPYLIRASGGEAAAPSARLPLFDPRFCWAEFICKE